MKIRQKDYDEIAKIFGNQPMIYSGTVTDIADYFNKIDKNFNRKRFLKKSDIEELE
jgi:hypothetical protein